MAVNRLAVDESRAPVAATRLFLGSGIVGGAGILGRRRGNVRLDLLGPRR
jgi:hypothetical protein